MTSEPSRCGLAVRARAGGAGERDDADLGHHEPGGHGGEGREGARRRVAAGDGDAARVPETVARAGQLGEPVGPGTGVLAAVPALPGGRVGEPVVGAAVDDEDVVRQLRGELRGPAVRQGEEDDVVSRELLGGGLGDRPVGEGGQVGLVGAEDGARGLPRRHRPDLDLGMAQGEPQHLTPDVSTGSGHGDAHTHHYARLTEIHATRGGQRRRRRSPDEGDRLVRGEVAPALAQCAQLLDRDRGLRRRERARADPGDTPRRLQSRLHRRAVPLDALLEDTDDGLGEPQLLGVLPPDGVGALPAVVTRAAARRPRRSRTARPPAGSPRGRRSDPARARR